MKRPLIYLTYQSQALRDKEWRRLRALGHDVKRSVQHNRLLHTQFVEDADHVKTEDQAEMFPTLWSKLYVIKGRGAMRWRRL